MERQWAIKVLGPIAGLTKDQRRRVLERALKDECCVMREYLDDIIGMIIILFFILGWIDWLWIFGSRHLGPTHGGP